MSRTCSCDMTLNVIKCLSFSLVLATLQVSAQEDAQEDDDRSFKCRPIIGGDDVDIVDVPYQLSLEYDGYHRCGAVIIKTHWALTAAHCVLKSPNLYTLRAGSTQRETGGTQHNVTKIVRHPKYNVGTRRDYDFALLRVSPPFVFGVGVAAIALPKPCEKFDAGTDVVVSGWGRVTEFGKISCQLEMITIPLVSHKQCAASLPSYNITPRMICAGKQEGGEDACQGDSGGPMVFDKKLLVGVVSWGVRCGLPGVPGVYAKVSCARKWIDANSAARTTTSLSPAGLLATLWLVVAVMR